MTRPIEFVRKAAFNVTAAFEGAGYGSYQNHDKGIVSYGRFQFTLAAGSLFTVLERYLAASQTATADALRQGYLGRVQAHDATLREDGELKRLLLEAANETAMQVAQDSVATDKYWDLVQSLSIQPRNIQSPLGQALLFDMAINHGPRHDMIGLAEEALGVPSRSRVPDNGVQEVDLIKRVALVRQDRMNRLAEKHNFPGLSVRGDFWVALVNAGDFDLTGDEGGLVKVKAGRWVRVFFPEEVPAS